MSGTIWARHALSNSGSANACLQPIDFSLRRSPAKAFRFMFFSGAFARNANARLMIWEANPSVKTEPISRALDAFSDRMDVDACDTSFSCRRSKFPWRRCLSLMPSSETMLACESQMAVMCARVRSALRFAMPSASAPALVVSARLGSFAASPMSCLCSAAIMELPAGWLRISSNCLANWFNFAWDFSAEAFRE